MILRWVSPPFQLFTKWVNRNKNMKINEIKANAKDAVLSRVWVAVFITLLYLLSTNIVSLCVTFPISGTGITPLLLSELATCISCLIVGLLRAGLCSFYLGYCTGRPVGIPDLFLGFFILPDRTLKATFLLTIIEIICLLPYNLYSFFMVKEMTVESFLIMMGLVLLGEILYLLVTLPFAPIYFLLMDMPELPLGKIFKMSAWLMKGNKLRYIGLHLSFIPLQLVGLLTLGIGNLWLEPYFNSAVTWFYLDAVNNRSGQQEK